MPESTPVVRCDSCGAYVRVRTDYSGTLHARHDCLATPAAGSDQRHVVDVGVNKTDISETEAAAGLNALFGR